jgi:uncharacterized protein (TIGR00299 family) protein
VRILYFDCFAGISGDMILGALLDLGLDLHLLESELSKLALDGYQLAQKRVDKLGIQANQFLVLQGTGQEESLSDSQFQEVHPPHLPDPKPHQVPGELHQHDQRDNHEHNHDHNYDQAQHGRTLQQILAIIAASQLSERIKTNATQIFKRLGQAESVVHNVPLDEVHFHEVGSLDAIIDIVGSCIALELSGAERIIASPLHLGSGFVRIHHGLYPIPAPATANLIQGIPVYSTEVRGELVTPTGAAIITTLAESFGPMPAMIVNGIGYGAGTRQREIPNVLRVIAGEATSVSLSGSTPRDPFPEQHHSPVGSAGYHESEAYVIETNIDDMNPQLVDVLFDRLLAAGALDVYISTVLMKKNRPGLNLHVLAHPSSLDILLHIVFRESTSIGARTYPVIKRMLQRELITVLTPYGPVKAKLARLGVSIVNITPEYEDCRQLASAANRPLKDVLAAAQAACQSYLDKGF